MTKAGYCRLLIVLLVAVGLSACSLPGLHLDAQGENTPWYKQNDARYQSQQDKQPEKDYKPKVVEITAELVSQMQGKSQQNKKVASLINSESQDKQYAVGPGDLLGIIVYNHPELTNPAGTTQSVTSAGRLVNAGGKVYFPFVGTMDVAGLTTGQIRKKLTKDLARVIRDPQVDVRVLKFRSKFVYVVGDVGRPCAVPITDIPLTVVNALDTCRARRTNSSNTELFAAQAVRLVRNGQTIPLDLNALYRSGKTLHLQADDRLILDNNANRVFMVGEFKQQTSVQISSAGGLSLSQAISDAEGLNLHTADASQVYVIRGFVDSEPAPDGGVRTLIRPRIYHLDADSVDALILANQFKLQPHDVVFAAPASLVNFNRALAQITPSLNALFRTAVIYRNVE